MYAGPFLGALIGFAVAGLLTDWINKFMIRKNNGIYEPEFRLVLVIGQLIFGAGGLYGFGFAAANVQPGGWFLPDFFFACEVGGMVLGAVASALYIVDAHRKYLPSIWCRRFQSDTDVAEIAVEAFTAMMIFKNIFSFGLTWGAYDWLTQTGIAEIFIIIASIQVAVCLLTIPMCKSPCLYPMVITALLTFLLQIYLGRGTGRLCGDMISSRLRIWIRSRVQFLEYGRGTWSLSGCLKLFGLEMIL